ncbi:MAG: hypothetical protein ACE14U_05860 [Candidatus Velamenicoccus archaeovorus]
MKKAAFMVLSAALLCCGDVPAEDVDPAAVPRMPEIQGWVADADWVGDKLVVNTGGDEITFVVTDNTEVEQFGKTISLNDVNQGDLVSVRYVDKQYVGLVAVQITDNAALRS